MHELALARAINEAAARHAAGRPVSTVRVRIGALRQAVPEPLSFYFRAVSEGGPCDGARLELELVAVELRCEACAHRWQPREPSFRCPACGAAEVELLSGEELEVKSIDVEEVARA